MRKTNIAIYKMRKPLLNVRFSHYSIISCASEFADSLTSKPLIASIKRLNHYHD